MPGQTANLPVVLLFLACRGCSQGLGFFPSQQMLYCTGPCSSGSCFCWELRDEVILCSNLHIPIFNIKNEKITPKCPQMNSFWGLSHPPVKKHHCPSNLMWFGHVAVGATKTQKEGGDGHVHAIIHMLMSCVSLRWNRSSLPCFAYLARAMEAFSLFVRGAVCS